jgi:hypothetical protein
MSEQSNKPPVYIETSIVSYLTAWPTSDTLRQAHQDLTKRWWSEQRQNFVLFTSQFVLDEAADGDSAAAAERLGALAGIDLLALRPEVEPLARQLLDAGALPAKARLDALHLAMATVHRMSYLLTWNCKHLANASLWRRIDLVCRSAGYQPPTICTPLELMGADDERSDCGTDSQDT